MNWEMIGAVGEVCGAVAVVVTLVYLARQIRDSTRQEQRQQMVQLRQRDMDWSGLLVANDDLADIWLRGLRGLGGLTERERSRFSFHVYSLFVTNELYLHLSEQDAIDRLQFEALDNTMAALARTPGIAQWWSVVRGSFSASYQAKVDRWIGETGPSLLDAYRAFDGFEDTIGGSGPRQ